MFFPFLQHFLEKARKKSGAQTAPDF